MHIVPRPAHSVLMHCHTQSAPGPGPVARRRPAPPAELARLKRCAEYMSLYMIFPDTGSNGVRNIAHALVLQYAIGLGPGGEEGKVSEVGRNEAAGLLVALAQA